MLSKMRSLVTTCILLLGLGSSDLLAASPTKKGCVTAKGAIVVRTKCRKTEKRLSAQMLNQEISTSSAAAGPAGPMGDVGVPGVVGSLGAIGQQGNQGPIGSKGPPGELNLSLCRTTTESFTTNFANPSNPVLYSEVFCNPNTEFLFEDESRVDFFPNSVGSRVALQGRLPYHQNIGGDVREYAVGVYANRYLAVGDGSYSLTVRAVCCPR